MIGSVFPHRLESVYLRSATLVSQLHKSLATNKNSTEKWDECDPIPSTQSTIVIVNGLGGGQGDGDSDPVKVFISKYIGLLQRLGFSGFMGVCSAVALKRVSREAATIVGIAFAGLQALSYYGYIHIDYGKVAGDAQKALDVNGDGKLDEKDLYSFWDKTKDILAYNLPNAASFSAGFVLGLRFA